MKKLTLIHILKERNEIKYEKKNRSNSRSRRL